METPKQVKEYQEAQREFEAKGKEVFALDQKRRDAKANDSISWTDADQEAFDTKCAEALSAQERANELKTLAGIAQGIADGEVPLAHVPTAQKRLITLREAVFGQTPEIKAATAVDGTAVQSYMSKGMRYDTGLRITGKDASYGAAIGSGNAVDALVVPDYTGELVTYPVPPTVAEKLFGAGRTNVNVWKYFLQDRPVFGAAFVGNTLTGEATKPASQTPYELITETTHVVAHYEPVHKTALSNIPQLESIIREQLLVGLRLELDYSLIWGDPTDLATPDSIVGLTNRGASNGGIPGIQSFTSRGVTGTQFLDDLKAMATASFMKTWVPASVVGMTPADADLVLTAKTAGSGQYIYGVVPFTTGNGTVIFNVWGMEIVQSPVFLNPDGGSTVIAGNPAFGKVVTQEDANITVGWVDKQFVQNAETLLCESTVGLEVTRPYGYVRMDLAGVS